MVAIKTVMPGTVPGAITRWTPPPTLEPVTLSSSIPPTAYGSPVKNVSGVAAKLESGNAATSVIGFLARPFPGSPSASNEGLGTDTPNKDYPQSLLRRGYLSVYCLGSTAPAKEGQAYVRVRDNGSTSRAIGTIEAAAGTLAATASAELVTGTNKGALTMDGSTPTLAGCQVGVYKAVCVEPGANVGQFAVYDPAGVYLGVHTVAGAAFATQIKFTIADGSADFVAGDYFTVTVVADCEAVPGAYFTGERDGSNITEIRYN